MGPRMEEHNATQQHLLIWISQPLPLRPTPLSLQSMALRCPGWDVLTTRCCMSLQVRFILHTYRKESRVNRIYFLSSEDITFTIMSIMRKVRFCWPKTVWSGNMRCLDRWERSGVCGHNWNVIQLSMYNGSSLVKYYAETALRGMSVKHNNDMSSHCGFNASIKNTS